MNKKLCACALAFLALLAGCGQEEIPEPTAQSCMPDAQLRALNGLRNEESRKAFIEECKAFEKAKQMRQWEFKPSPKDNY